MKRATLILALATQTGPLSTQMDIGKPKQTAIPEAASGTDMLTGLCGNIGVSAGEPPLVDLDPTRGGGVFLNAEAFAQPGD